MNKVYLGIVSACMLAMPAVAGQVFDTQTVGPDTSLSDGAGTTGPGMSGSYSLAGTVGQADSKTRMESVKNGKSGSYRIKSGFSNRAIFNNDADLAQPHIR